MRSPLHDQIEKISRHARIGSIDSRRRYRKAIYRFADWLHFEYGVKKLENISNKHLAHYVSCLLSKGCKATYITTELSGIRYYHDQLTFPRCNLERDNSKLGLPKREAPGDRAWNKDEFTYICNIAEMQGKGWIREVLTLQKELGLRLHEVLRVDRNHAKKALEKGQMLIKGKGGKIRETRVLTKDAEDVLNSALSRTVPGEKLFVPQNKKTHQVIQEIQLFIKNNRKEKNGPPNTSHGLRYNYAQNRFQEAVKNQKSIFEVERTVANELGHNRHRVTRGYVR